MDIHYNAFISYRHHPLDIKVAEQIHKGLERYHLPRALRKRYKQKLRLFRDKEELPITSNLSDDITKALTHSDFLIVICSTHTKESLWVQREIETFLMTHDHSRVLTVLVDGQDPYEILPEILCSREETDPETGEKRLLPMEPLSCDWRVSKAKARREELPRLAAALLGCGYDELRQRERQYRTRRMVTVFSVALAATLGLMGYVLYNSLQIQKMNDRLSDANIRIQENLDEALSNQSKHLASASEKLMEEGDRMTALALALEALPKQAGERPYVVEAERALSEAVGAYQAERVVSPIGTIMTDGVINHFEMDDERDIMFVTESQNVLSVWYMEDFQKQAAVELEATAQELLMTAGNNLLLLDVDGSITCYDTALQVLWQKRGYSDMALSTDRQTVIVQSQDWVNLATEAEGEKNRLEFLRADTGEEAYKPVQIYLDETHRQEKSHELKLMDQNYDLSAPVLLEYYNFEEAYILVAVDAQKGSFAKLDDIPLDMRLRYTGLTGEGNILVLLAGENYSWNEMFNTMKTRSSIPVQVRYYTPEGECLWKTDFTSCSVCRCLALEPVGDGSRIYCQIDNVAALIDTATGKLLGNCEIGANAVWVQAEADTAVILQEDGYMGTYMFDKNEYNTSAHMKNDLVEAICGKGIFVRQRHSNQILCYAGRGDENWQMIEGDYNANVENRVVKDHLLATAYYDGICLFDIRQQKLLWDRPEDKTQSEYLKLIGFSEDGKYLFVRNSVSGILALDTTTGKEQAWKLPRILSLDAALLYNTWGFSLREGNNVYTLSSEVVTDATYLTMLDMVTGTTEYLEVCQPARYDLFGPPGTLLSAREQTAYVWEETTSAIYRVDFAADTVSVFRENVSAKPVMQKLDEKGSYLLCTGNLAEWYEADGTLRRAITLEKAKGVSGFLYEDQFLLLTDGGKILRYDSQGNFLGETNTHIYTSFASDLSMEYLQEEIRWTLTPNGDLVLQVFNAGNLIDTDQWQLKAWIPECVAYDATSDQFVTYNRYAGEERIPRLGVYKRYTLDKLQEMGKEALHGFALTQEQKNQYGIS